VNSGSNPNLVRRNNTTPFPDMRKKARALVNNVFSCFLEMVSQIKNVEKYLCSHRKNIQKRLKVFSKSPVLSVFNQEDSGTGCAYSFCIETSRLEA
jgi:hypothetical protein